MSEPLIDIQSHGNTTRRAFLGVDNSESMLKLSSSHVLDNQKMAIYFQPQILGQQNENNSNFMKKSVDQIDEKDFSQNSDDYNSFSERAKSQKSKNTGHVFDLTTKKIESPSSGQDHIEAEHDDRQSSKVNKEHVVVQKSKFNDLVFEVRMKNKARKLANSTHSRMEKNLTAIQIGMIGDITAQDGYQKNFPEETYENIAIHKSTRNLGMDSRRGLMNQFLHKIEIILPLIDPRNIWKTIFEILSLFGVLLIFFFMSVVIAFKVTIEQVIPPLAIEISLGFIFANSFVNLNTGFYQAGKLTTDRQLILRAYKETHLIPDLMAFMSTVMLLIINSTDFLKNHENTYSDSQSFLRILIFLPFCIKIRDISKLTLVIEEKVIFRPQAKNFLQLATLFSTIILIEHIIACLWIFQAKLSFNMEQNWQTVKQLEMETWFRQYSLSFYYSTVTMTTVGNILQEKSQIVVRFYNKFLKIGYGDITPTNQFEYIFSTILIIVSSGVFAFTLNQIGVIFTELGAEEKETRRKINIINMYMEKRNLGQALRTQIRQYLKQKIKRHKYLPFFESIFLKNKSYVWLESNEQFANDSSAMIEQLNDSLKRELKLHQNKRIIQYLNSHYSEKFIEKAIALIEEVQCKPQQVICTAGQSEDLSLFLVEKGKVEMYYKTKPIKQTSQYQFNLHEIGEGQLFGARNFYTGKPIDLNIRAIGFSNLLRIKRQDFLNLLQESPEDMEMFCYIRDRMDLLSDHWKADSKCPSCNSFKHDLLNCEYLHYIPNHQNLCLQYAYVPKLTSNPERVYLGTKEEGGRREAKLITRFDLTTLLEQFIFDNIQDIESHEQTYLQYKLDFAYVSQNDPPERDEEDDELVLNQEQQIFSHSQNAESKSVKFGMIHEEVDPKVCLHQPNTEQQQAKKNNNYFTQEEDFDKEMFSPAREDHQEEQQSLGFEKQTSINLAMSPGRGRNTSKRKLSSSFSNLSPKGFVLHRVSSFSNSHQNPVPNASQRLIQARSFVQLDASEMSKNVDQKEGSLVFCPSKANNGSLIPAGSENSQQLSPLRRSKMDISQESFRPVGSMFKSPQSQQYYQGNLIVPQSTSNYNQNLLPNLPGMMHVSSEKKNISHVVAREFKSMQTSLLEKIHKMLQQKVPQQQSSSPENNNILNEKSYEDDFLSSQQIFRYFDKQKNFEVYFPFHNLTYILMKIHKRQQRTLEAQLDGTNKKNKQFPPLSTTTIVRTKYDKSKTKIEKSMGISTRSMNKQLTQVEYMNGRRRGEFFDKLQFGVGGLAGQIDSSMTISDRNILSTRSMNNKGFPFNQMFSRNDVSINEVRYPEISPTVKEIPEGEDDDVREIHNLEVESKRSYFSNFSVD